MARPGDWQCRHCGFQPNFSHRRGCYSCGKLRSGQAAAGSGRGTGSLLGPVGAGGLRPQLSWGAARASTPAGRPDAPTFRAPGSSVAARAIEAKSSGPLRAAGATVAAGGGPAGGQTATGNSSTTHADDMADDDGDGFQTVQPRGKARRKLGGAGGSGRVADGHGSGNGANLGGGGGGGACGPTDGDADAAGDDHDADAEEAPAPADLRRRWQSEIAVVKRLGQQGLSADHPAMVAACQARDDAERAWREAKDPTPLSVRLSRAQAKVDRAVNLMADTRTAIQQLEDDYKSKRATLEEKLAEDRSRVQMRRQQLEQVQAEAGAGSGGAATQQAGRDAARRVHSAMCNDMAPAVAALVEQVSSDSPAWQILNGLLSQLATSQHELQQAFQEPPTAAQRQQQQQQPHSFDIGDDGAQDPGDGDGSSEWSESHDLRAHGGDDPNDDGWGPWTCPQLDPAQDQSMGGGEWWDDPHWKSRTKWTSSGYGQWSRTSWADSWEEERQQDGEEATQGAAKHRRKLGQSATSTSAEADGTAAASSVPSGEAEAAAAARLRQYNERVSAIVSTAIDRGIQPITDEGEELHVLTPAQLDEWVAAKLPSA